MPAWLIPAIGPAVKWGLALAILLVAWAMLRWLLRRAEKSQGYQDEIEKLRRERAEDQKKLAAAAKALEAYRAAARDRVTGLPSDLGLQSRPKPHSGPVAESDLGGSSRP